MTAQATMARKTTQPLTPVEENTGPLDDHVIEKLSDVFKMLADPSRLKILLTLAHDGEMHVKALCDLVKQSQPAVSHHLTLMKAMGLVARRRDGKHNFYRVESITINRLLEQFRPASKEHEHPVHFDELLLFLKRN